MNIIFEKNTEEIKFSFPSLDIKRLELLIIH